MRALFGQRATTAVSMGAFFAGIGCSNAVHILETPPEARSLVSWVVWVEGRMEASSQEAIRLELEADVDMSELVLLAYDRTLQSLGIEPGPLAARVPCRTCELGRPLRAWTSSLESDGSSSDWALAAPLPNHVFRDLVPDAERCDRCRPFADLSVLADEPPDMFTKPAFVTPWANGELVAYRDGTFRLLNVSRSALEPPSAACIAVSEFQPRLGYRATETVLWIVDRANRVHRLDLDRLDPGRSCAEAATLSSTTAWAGPILEDLAGPSSATPSELYGVGTHADRGRTVLSRYTFDGRTEILGELGGENSDADIAVAGPGDLVAVNGSSGILRMRDGTTRFERVEAGGSPLFTSSVTYHPTRGYLLGTSNTLAVVEDGLGGYREVAAFVSSAQRVISIAPYQDGLVIGERNGTFRRYYDGIGYCPGQRGFGTEPLRHLLEGAEGQLIGGEDRLYYALAPEDSCEP